MSDIIQLLPETVANQIAAGEVIQRPASVVKELMENAVDAKSNRIGVTIQEAGKTLIMVNDNGRGMSDTDARMSLERHATSKIREADDLFRITTKGFRGEALASITSISHFEMRTREEDDTMGTRIESEGNRVLAQEPVSCSKGTSIRVKNLFYNVPARRNFLKSDAVEFNHICEEFIRVAMAHPEIAFSLEHNGQEQYRLEKSTLRQRVSALMGSGYNEKLVPVQEDTDLIKINGFVTKPEFSKKRRGEQYFFLNNRFIRNTYLHHAVTKAFDQLIPADAFPSYFLFIEVAPSFVDVNIHPTKTEVKFEDEKAVYLILRSAVRRSLGIYNIAPSLDFNQEPALMSPMPVDFIPQEPRIRVNPQFNPFQRELKLDTPKQALTGNSRKNSLSPFEQFDTESMPLFSEAELAGQKKDPENEIENNEDQSLAEEQYKTGRHLQVGENLILTRIKTGVLVIHQQNAHQRILYERILHNEDSYQHPSQKLLYPHLLELNPIQSETSKKCASLIEQMGFELQPMGGRAYSLSAIPTGMNDKNCMEDLEKLLEDLHQHVHEAQTGSKEFLARLHARNFCIKKGQKLDEHGMQSIVDELFACREPYFSPDGKPAIYTLTLEELTRKFR